MIESKDFVKYLLNGNYITYLWVPKILCMIFCSAFLKAPCHLQTIYGFPSKYVLRVFCVFVTISKHVLRDFSQNTMHVILSSFPCEHIMHSKWRRENIAFRGPFREPKSINLRYIGLFDTFKMCPDCDSILHSQR